MTEWEGWTPEAIRRLEKAAKEVPTCDQCGRVLKEGETIESHLKIEHPEGE